MFTLLRSLSLRQVLSQQVPLLAVSFVIAEIFYKLHSFSLECGAFLATWFVLDLGVCMVQKKLTPKPTLPETRAEQTP